MGPLICFSVSLNSSLPFYYANGDCPSFKLTGSVSACFMCTHCSSGCQLAPNPISTSSLLVSVLYRFDRKHASLPNTSVRVMHVKLFYGAFIGRTECAPAVPYRSFTYDAALISVALSRLVKYFLPQVANLLVPLSLVAHLVSHDRQVHY